MGKLIVFIAVIIAILFSIIFYLDYQNKKNSNAVVTENGSTEVVETAEATSSTESASANGQNFSTGSDAAEFMLPYATITIPGLNNATVKLNNGTAEYQSGNQMALVHLVPGFYAERETSEGYDLYGVVTVNSGGSGDFFYLVMFQYFADSLNQTDSLWIGDRIDLYQIGVRDSQNNNASYEALVEYLVHGEDQAMAETPVVEEVLVAQVKDHKFIDSEVQNGWFN